MLCSAVHSVSWRKRITKAPGGVSKALQPPSRVYVPAQRGVSAGTRRLAPPAPPKKAAPSGGGLFGIGTKRVGASAPRPVRSGTAKVRTSAPAAAYAGTRAVRSGAHPNLPFLTCYAGVHDVVHGIRQAHMACRMLP